MDISPDEFFANFGKSINHLVLSHRKALERKWARERNGKTKYSKSEPKMRWVDGTPEYSMHIRGLGLLFPEARFVHVVRNVDAVVRSMLNFHRVAGAQLVANEEEAYHYWLRTVNACLTAERAYGPRIVHRLRYAVLIEDPERAMRSLFDFLGESYTPRCLEPLAQRINSSNVPADFKSEDPATDPTVVERARRLSAQLEETAQPSEAYPAAADEMEAIFREQGERKAALQRQLEHQNMGVEQLSEQLSQRTLEMAKLERHLKAYEAEIEQYKAHLARQEEHYTGEGEQLRGEIEQLRDRIREMERLLHSRSVQVAEDEKRIVELTDRLRKQLWNTKKLSRLLDNAGSAAARLRKSRRWKLANPGTAIKAILSHGKVSVGYDHLDKIVKSYSQWRASYPEVAKIDDEIKSVQFPNAPNSPRPSSTPEIGSS
jgi:hypothetical protein